jgi:hypothetical protein
VYPNLYPSAPIPRGNPFRWHRGIVALLWSAAIVLAGACGTLGLVGMATLTAGPVVVAGVVLDAGNSSAVPLPGAVVHLWGESGHGRSAVTDIHGAFRFSPVAVGGISMNVTYRGFAPATLQLFASPYYASSGLASLRILLSHTNLTGSTQIDATSFVDLESYITSLGTGAFLLGVGTLGAILGARAAERPRPGSAVVAAGAGAAITPAAFYVLGLTSAFPVLWAPAAFAAAFGGAGAAMATGRRWLLGPFEGDPSEATSERFRAP